MQRAPDGTTDGTEIWREPVRGGYPDPAVMQLPGRERLELWIRDRVPPPLSRLTGTHPRAVGDGTAEAGMPASGWLLNSAGLISGGTLTMVVDVAFGCAVETKLPPATPYTTAELSLTFLRPARPGAVLSAHGQSIHVGRSIGLAEAFLIQPEGDDLIAHGTSRLAIMPPLERIPERGRRAAGDGKPGRPGRNGEQDPDPYLRAPPTEGILPQDVWDELPGREVLRRQIAGALPPPPIQRLTGLGPVEAGDGEATVRMPASEWLNSPAGRLQGGTIAMLADSAMLNAVLTTADAGTAIAGLDLKVNFLRPVPADGRDLVARARVEHGGRTLAISAARLENADRKPVALATGTVMYLPGRPARLGPEVELSHEAEAGWRPAAGGRSQ